jgi:Rrf2 family iron-sulfur cluster assembly transcriptional regulator
MLIMVNMVNHDRLKPRRQVMRISTKGRHAVMAMVDLALNGQGKPISLAEIAERQEISLSYMEQLIACLKKQGLVKSTRGPGGGYMLGTSGDHITVSEIVSAVDGTTERQEVDDPVTASARQITDLLWQSVSDEVSGYLEKVTLADVCNCNLAPVPEEGRHDETIFRAA